MPNSDPDDDLYAQHGSNDKPNFSENNPMNKESDNNKKTLWGKLRDWFTRRNVSGNNSEIVSVTKEIVNVHTRGKDGKWYDDKGELAKPGKIPLKIRVMDGIADFLSGKSFDHNVNKQVYDHADKLDSVNKELLSKLPNRQYEQPAKNMKENAAKVSGSAKVSRECRHEIFPQRIIPLRHSPAKYDLVFLAYLVAIPRHSLNF